MEESPRLKVTSFSVSSDLLKNTDELRLDASFFNPKAAEALSVLERTGYKLVPLGKLVTNVFIPGRFKRVYVSEKNGVPFLQGSHVVHFVPADLKFVSPSVHKKLDSWRIYKGWILVTRSGTVGRVAITTDMWNNWAASEHILRIIPKDTKECPAGYLYAYLASELGQIS